MPEDHSSAAWLLRFRLRQYYKETNSKPCTGCQFRQGRFCTKFNADLVQFPFDDRLWPVVECVQEKCPEAKFEI